MGGWSYLGQRLRAAERERGDGRDRNKFLIGRLTRPRGW